MGSTNYLSRKNQDLIGSTNSLLRKSREHIGSMNSLSRKSSIDTKKSSTDSLDLWHGTWDAERNDSVLSLTHDDKRSSDHNKVIILNSDLLFGNNKF